MTRRRYKYDTGDVDMDVTEAGVDMAVDMGVETAPDMSVDTAVVDTGADMAPPDMAGDMSTGDTMISDAPTTDASTSDVSTSDVSTSDAVTADMSTTDATTGDAAQPKKAWALYGVNSSSTKYTLNQVNIDGTGQKLFPGPPANIDLCDLKLTGNTIYQDVDQTKPVPVVWAGEEYIRLPNGDRLYHWSDGTDYGLGLLKPDGTFEAPVDQLARATSTGSCTTDYYVAVSKDGKLAAVVLEGTKVALVKLDGTTWSGTTPASEILDITPTGTTNIKEIFDDSLTIGAKSLLFVVDETSGNDSLYAAPLDGSAKATKVTLPQVDGAAPIFINANMATNTAGDHFVIVAGAANAKEGVIVYKDGATPATTLVSNLVSNYLYPGTYFMDSLEPKIGFSPSGKYIAFTTTTSDKKLFVATSDGVTKWDLSNNFTQTGSAAVDNFGAFYWTDDDNLLFWAGTSATSIGLYHFKASTKAVTNLAGSSLTTSPWDGGNLVLDGGWLSPNGKFLYLLVGTSADAVNLWSVDLTALTAKAITTGLDIDSGADMDTGVEVVPNSNLVAFIAKADTDTTSPYFYDLYVFDQSTGATASVKKLTSTPTTGTSSIYINNILPSPDGKYVGYTTNSGATELLTIVPTAGGASTALNGTGSYLEDAYWWTPDSASVVYAGSSTSTSTLDLKIVPVTGGASTTLHASQSYSFVFGGLPLAQHPTPPGGRRAP